MYTVSGCSVDVAKAFGAVVKVEGRVQRERVGFGTVVVLGSHHHNLSNVLECFIQSDYARGLVAVVVGDQ